MSNLRKSMLFLLGFLAFANGPNPASHAEQPLKRRISVLFIGNSHTMGVPTPLAKLINSTSRTTEIEVDLALKGGSHLIWHWNDTEQNDVVNRIKRNRYDYVVIQESGAATGSPDFRAEMQEYVPRFVRLVNSTGAKSLLFCTHEYYNNAHNTHQDTINAAYWRFALENDADFVPIGPICKKIRDEQNLILHNVPDPIHANRLGQAVYLYTLYCYLTGEPILGRHTPDAAKFFLPKRSEDVRPPGERFKVSKSQMRAVKQELSEAQLVALQKTVFEEVMHWKAKQTAAKTEAAKSRSDS